MPRNRLPVLAALAILFAVGCRSPEPLPTAEERQGTGALLVVIEGFENAEGQALINVFLGREGFPGDARAAWRALERPIVDLRVEVVIEDVPAGPVAVSVFHDVDADFELDTGIFGIPSEPWGVSRDASGFMGPPSYDAARLELQPGESMTVEIRFD